MRIAKSWPKLCTAAVAAVKPLHTKSPSATMERRTPKSAQRATGSEAKL